MKEFVLLVKLIPMGQHLNKSAKGLIVQEKGTEFAKKVGYI